MALKGNLRDFSTTQLLNLINLAKKTGTLVIDGPGQVAQMSFRNGKLVFAQLGQDDGALTTILHKSGKLTEEQAKALKARAASASDKDLFDPQGRSSLRPNKQKRHPIIGGRCPPYNPCGSGVPAAIDKRRAGGPYPPEDGVGPTPQP